MNIREGMRRLGILLGIAGGLLGGFLAFPEAQSIWRIRTAHQKFDSLMATPTMQKVVKGIPAGLSIPSPLSDGRSLGNKWARYARPAANGLLEDPEFYALSTEERREAFSAVDSDFKNLPLEEQDKVLNHFKQKALTVAASQDEDGSTHIFQSHPLLSGNRDGINKVHLDATKTVSSIELSTGESAPRTESRAPTTYFLLLLYPVFGFLLPWGCIRILAWVGTGFVAPRG